FLLARAALRVQIRPAARAQPATLLAAQRLDRWGERDQLARKAAEVDLRPLVPPHLELVAEAHPEARQVARRLRFGRHPRARRLQDQPKGLAERDTIAREAAAALEVEGAREGALQVEMGAHPVRAQLEDGALGQLRDQLAGLGAPRFAGLEAVLGRAVLDAIDEQLHRGPGPSPA